MLAQTTNFREALLIFKTTPKASSEISLPSLFFATARPPHKKFSSNGGQWRENALRFIV